VALCERLKKLAGGIKVNDRRSEYLRIFRALRKSDLHSHAGRGGNRKYIEELYGVKIENPPNRFLSLKHMQECVTDHKFR